MKFLLSLFLIAVVVSVKEARRSHRGSVSEECQPGDCLIKDGRLCACSKHGSGDNAECPSFFSSFMSQIFGNPFSCNCNPDTVFDSDTHICTCPRHGELSFDDCTVKCTPGQCFMRDGRMCRCPDDGDWHEAACNDRPEHHNATARQSEVSCDCEPGFIFQVNDWRCSCPGNGVLRPGNCKYIYDYD